MRLLIYSVITLALSVLLAQTLREDTGYVLIGMGKISIEMSFVMFCILSIITIFLAHYLLRTLSGIGNSPRKLKNWRHKRQEIKASKDFSKGLLAQKEGQWQKAERSLIAKVENSNQPVINYLEAAKAATALGANERAERYLRLAQNVAPKKDTSVEATRIELLLSEKKTDLAIEQLQKLIKLHPKNTRFLELLAQAYRMRNEWQNVIELLPRLHKHHALSLDAYLDLESTAYQGLLNESLRTKDGNRIRNSWSSLPKHMQNNPELIYTYARGLIAIGESSTTEALLRQAINQQWNDKLVYLYGFLTDVNTHKQIDQAEKWLFNHKNDSTLLLTLGRLNMKQKLWGKARSYLENSLSLKPSPQAYYEMAKLLEEIDEKDKASDCYRQGLILAADERRNAVA